MLFTYIHLALLQTIEKGYMMIRVEVWKSLKERPVDVIVAPIFLGPGELGWDSMVDRAIKNLSGTLYYKKLMAEAMRGKLNLEVFLAKGFRDDHNGTFNHVLFVPLACGPRARTLYKALVFAHENEMKDILVPLSPHWLDSPIYFGIGREYPRHSLEILKMSLALVEEEIEGIDLTVNFGPCVDDVWSRRLISDLKKRYRSDSKKGSFWQSIEGFFSRN
jgi:hypothetical protein